jgi:drug/metabolite transporter (DMT)-like permease
VGVALQALEARATPKRLSLRLGLLGPLLRRPLWLAGLALGAIGVAPQVLAFAWAPFAVVQTALAAGLVVLLAIAARALGETVDRGAIAGVALIVAGVALVSWGAPAHAEAHRGNVAVLAVVGVTVALTVIPFATRETRIDRGLVVTAASGIGFAATNITTKLMSDDTGLRHWSNAVTWGAAALALGVAATVVVPISTAVQTFLPILFEPLFLRERLSSATAYGLPIVAGALVATAGSVLVARTRAVSELAAGGSGR